MRFAPQIAFTLLMTALLTSTTYAGTAACTAGQETAGYCVAGEVLWAFDAPTDVIDEFEAIIDGEDLADLDGIDVDWLQFVALFAIDNEIVCDANDVTISVCRDSTSQSAIMFAMQSTNIGELSNAIRPDRWDTVRCESGDVVTIPGVSIPVGVTPPFWAAATTNDLITDGDCTVGQIGQYVANPRNVRFWAWKYTRNQIRLAVLLKRLKTDLEAAESSLDTDVDIGGDN